MNADLRLALMTFPQAWDGGRTLTLNALLIPSVDPLVDPLVANDPATPPFAAGRPALQVMVNAGLATMPDPAAAVAVAPAYSRPADPASTFRALESIVTVKATIAAPVAAAPVTTRIRKALPDSFVAAGGAPPDGELTTGAEDYACAMRCDDPPVPKLPPAPQAISWGEVISYALRQPLLAAALGLRYTLSIDLDDAQVAALADGGYVFVALDPADPWAAAQPGEIRMHAARIPPLDATPRTVFAAVQFAVGGAGNDRTDDAMRVAETYSDGFAKLVHCSQPDNLEVTLDDGELPPATDLGIQIGWDDRQVVTWHNDQLSLLAARVAGPDALDAASQAPLGVLGYRVDVADVTPTPADPAPPPRWESLVRVHSDLPAPLDVAFDGELTVEPVPTRPATASAADAWLPRYFATWRGGSLCEPDTTPHELTSRTAAAQPPSRTALGLTTLLSYGNTYAFRVRLADLSSGGPEHTAGGPLDPSPSSTATQTFRRLVPPKSPDVTQIPAPAPDPDPGRPPPPGMPDTLEIRRPIIGYPEVLYTHLGDDAPTRDAIRVALVAQAVSGATATAGLPDPDVDAVEIEVSVRHPLHDVGLGNSVYGAPLYRVTRALRTLEGAAPLVTDPGTSVALEYVEAPDVAAIDPPGPNAPLPIPRGRDVRITVRSKLREDEPDYFGAQIGAGLISTIAVRCEV
ncbi:MAG: hypothetical protein QOE11_1323, partial [Solirubrobacteraceae bacterium]|nr:hypothetical protein [Solirubrobacteraceae bacterium]